jgi:hypothetical protein
MMANSDDGNALAMVVVILTVLAVVALGLARVGARAANQARARTAADAVALATASGGVDAGRRVAQANRASVVSIRTLADGGVSVVVSVNGETAAASATLVDAP